MEDYLSSIGHPAGLPRAMLVGFLDAVPASAAILDSNANVIAVNAAWRRFAVENGGDPEAWIGRNYLAIADGSGDADAGMIADGMRAVLNRRLEHFDHEYPCHSPVHQRWFRCLVAPLADDDGDGLLGGAVMHLDITGQKLAEQRALTASRAKSEFLASLSHELRTPLNAILGFSEMLRLQAWGPIDEPRYVSYAGDIHAAGSHLLSLINEVLDLSKIEAGRFELREEQVDVAAVVRQALALVATRAEDADIVLGVIGLDQLPALRGDTRLLRQVLLNLLSNAVKFTPAGGTIVTGATITAEGWLELSVADTGIGIKPEDFSRVLEPFGQVDSEMARRYSGESTGLGLPLARRFTELHGGRLRLNSMPGNGTTVTVCFPPERLATQ